MFDDQKLARLCALHIATGLLLGSMVQAGGAAAATLEVCRPFDLATPLMSGLAIPRGSLYRDNGRADDPLAAFTGDYWQLRLETVGPAVIAPLRQCTRVLVRVTSDSSVKAVSAADNRRFVYAGSSMLLDRRDESEELLSTRAR